MKIDLNFIKKITVTYYGYIIIIFALIYSLLLFNFIYQNIYLFYQNDRTPETVKNKIEVNTSIYDQVVETKNNKQNPAEIISIINNPF